MILYSPLISLKNLEGHQLSSRVWAPLPHFILEMQSHPFSTRSELRIWLVHLAKWKLGSVPRLSVYHHTSVKHSHHSKLNETLIISPPGWNQPTLSVTLICKMLLCTPQIMVWWNSRSAEIILVKVWYPLWICLNKCQEYESSFRNIIPLQQLSGHIREQSCNRISKSTTRI